MRRRRHALAIMSSVCNHGFCNSGYISTKLNSSGLWITTCLAIYLFRIARIRIKFVTTQKHCSKLNFRRQMNVYVLLNTVYDNIGSLNPSKKTKPKVFLWARIAVVIVPVSPQALPQPVALWLRLRFRHTIYVSRAFVPTVSHQLHLWGSAEGYR